MRFYGLQNEVLASSRWILIYTHAKIHIHKSTYLVGFNIKWTCKLQHTHRKVLNDQNQNRCWKYIMLNFHELCEEH